MATPTPGRNPAQAVATPSASTPFSTSNPPPAFSPHGPRSVVPSPAQHFKKSPANSNTLYGYPSGSGGGHPTNSSFGAGYDSPSAAMALGGVPGLMDLGVDGQGLGPLGTLGRGDEEEKKRRRWIQVMDILKENKGRLSEPGIERLAKRVGLECLWEDQIGSGGSMRTLIIAGSALALDINFANNVVKKVALSFPDSPEIVTRHTDKAGDILLRDLEFSPGHSPLTKMLDRFAANLERLAALDKLSVIPVLNCHEAIAGIYENLERLHKWEAAGLKEQDDMAGKGEEYIDRVAMCTKSGKPVMHTRDRLGLSLDYWQEQRRIQSKGTATEERIWSLLIECAPLTLFDPNHPCTSLRVSEKWISPDVKKADPGAEDLLMVTDGPVLDWLEPENILLPFTEQPSGMEGIDQPSQNLPNVMFVAKFDPPLIVPSYGFALETGAMVDPYQTATFDILMFPPRPNEKIEPGETRTFTQQKQVPNFGKDGRQSMITHNNTLMIEKVDYGRTLAELPFDHPRKLVELLPSLRQYAFISTLLRKSFNPSPSKDAFTEEPKPSTGKSKKQAFEEFMAQSTNTISQVNVDVTFTAQPVPRISLHFPFKKKIANVVFEIKPNAVVEVTSENVLDSEAEGSLSAADLGNMLEITEDLGIWVEFVRRRLG